VRVVSLVPSATESLLEWDVVPVAVTRFCEHPELPDVGGTKNPDLDAIVGLEPDLVVMCVEENRAEDAAGLRDAGCELFVFDVDGVDDVAAQLGALASRLDVDPALEFELGSEGHEPSLDARVFVPIWRRPWMTLSGHTYGSSLLARIGLRNLFADAVERYPETTLDAVQARRPDVVLAPSEPYPFTARHRAELEAVAPVVFVDGKDLFWWGVRTPSAIERLRQQLVRELA
jgi:ABC-type Fe3+-hydroxamate transport system substrate-binding protein